MYSVYKVTNKVNGKIYIGWTSKNPQKRWYQHYQDAFQRSGKRRHLHHSMVKYGYEHFSFEVIYQTSDYEHSQSMESYFIKRFNSFKRDCGYNLSFGGESNLWTKERKEEWGRRHKGEGNRFFGKHHSEETKKRLSEQRKGIKSDPEVVERRASKLRGRKRNTLAVQSIALSKIKKHPLFDHIDYIASRLREGLPAETICRELYEMKVRNKNGNRFCAGNVSRYINQLKNHNLIEESLIEDNRGAVYHEENANLLLSLFSDGVPKAEIGRILFSRGLKNKVGKPFSSSTIQKILNNINKLKEMDHERKE